MYLYPTKFHPLEINYGVQTRKHFELHPKCLIAPKIIGYGWLTRRIVSFASVDKVFTKVIFDLSE